MIQTNLTILILLLIIGYIILYFGGRKYLEHFKDDSDSDSDSDSDKDKKHKKDKKDKKHKKDKKYKKVNIDYAPETPYLENPINSVDDYELSLVFQNQGSKEVSKKQISDAMTRYPIDWTVQGPDSQTFQDNQVKYEKKKANELNNPSSIANNKDVSLPDSLTMDAEEMKILQTYEPESSKGLLEYSLDDVKSLLEKVYLKKGLIPVIEKSKQGQNIWEIVEVKEKDPHIVWEDDTRDRMTQRGEEIIEVPHTVSDVSAGLDPFFKPRNGIRDGKYNNFTPGLERMFAPTQPIKSWY